MGERAPRVAVAVRPEVSHVAERAKKRRQQGDLVRAVMEEYWFGGLNEADVVEQMTYLAGLEPMPKERDFVFANRRVASGREQE